MPPPLSDARKNEHLHGAPVVIRQLAASGSFSPEEISTMVAAYEAVRERLRNQGPSELVNEQIAKRILALAKLKALNAEEIASRVLASFGFRSNPSA
jgi:hypothetical protein